MVGAGYTISPQTGDIATYVKLLRVTMLLPVVFAIALVVAALGGGEGSRPRCPCFSSALPAGFGEQVRHFAPLAVDVANEVSRWCLVTAIAALGMKTSFKELSTPAGARWR